MAHQEGVSRVREEVVLHQPKPVALLTPDSDDMTKLCRNQVRIILL